MEMAGVMRSPRMIVEATRSAALAREKIGAQFSPVNIPRARNLRP